MLSIQRESFGDEEPSRFAKLFFERHSLTVMARPGDLDEMVRGVISASEAKKVLKHLETCEEKVSSKWKARANQHAQVIERGDPYELGSVYKGLTRMESDGQSLRAADRKHLKMSFECLTDELAAALGKEHEEVAQMITKRCSA